MDREFVQRAVVGFRAAFWSQCFVEFLRVRVSAKRCAERVQRRSVAAQTTFHRVFSSKKLGFDNYNLNRTTSTQKQMNDDLKQPREVPEKLIQMMNTLNAKLDERAKTGSNAAEFHAIKKDIAEMYEIVTKPKDEETRAKLIQALLAGYVQASLLQKHDVHALNASVSQLLHDSKKATQSE